MIFLDLLAVKAMEAQSCWRPSPLSFGTQPALERNQLEIRRVKRWWEKRQVLLLSNDPLDTAVPEGCETVQL